MSFDSATRLAVQSGPFFFAILFALVMLPRAVKQFQEVRERRDSLSVDHWIFGAYFLLTFAVLVGLVSFASWWWASHPPMYVVNGAIHKLNAVEVWSPDPMFFKKQYDQPMPGVTPTFDVNFLAYQEKPFGDGTFEIRYRKPYDPDLGTPDFISVSVPRDGSHYDFDAVYNEKSGMNELVPRLTAPARPQRPSTAWSFTPTAYAAPLPQMSSQAQQRQISSGVIPAPSVASVHNAIVTALQSVKVYTGSEIQALDNVRRASATDRAQFTESEVTEPMIISLLDLTRHEDHELRSKARALLEGVDIRSIFARKLSGTGVRDIYFAALTRIDVRTALAILKGISHDPNPTATRALRHRIEAAAWAPRFLSATTSSHGDRYWLAVGWRDGDRPSEKCVADTFSNSRGPDMGPESMRSPTMRQIFSYSKQRILDLADRIEIQCPATAESFAHG
jgi:hypothetical protein